MKQILQSLSNGSTEVVSVPAPTVGVGQILIRSSMSLLSSGTERMLKDFGQANLLEKARLQPEKLQDVLNKAATDGVFSTYSAIKSKLTNPIALGYCNVGTVIGIADDVQGFSVGDRVVSNGPHAEIVSVPKNLCAVIPDNVTDAQACFTIPASIGLQGIRLAQPALGEVFVVSGLGLIGLLTAQLLLSNGCTVFGIDPDPDKCLLASSLGITTFSPQKGDDISSRLLDFTNSVGVDGFIVAASTSSSDPLDIAARSLRKRGRIVLVGVTGMTLKRELFYKKELSLQVSCSYGPGRYDPFYEELGNDYPIGYVRWTEQRNFEAVLDSLAKGSICVDPLITHEFSIDSSTEAYDLLTSSLPSLGILINYPFSANSLATTIPLGETTDKPSLRFKKSTPVVSVIGAGNYSSRKLIPELHRAGASLHTLVASTGIAPVHFGGKFGFLKASTDVPALLADPSCNTVVIATRHDSHASLVKQALAAGKHVFVEKPLCLTHDELNEIEAAHSLDQLLMVGFNRRFAPLTTELQNQLTRLSGPKAFVYTCNAGAIPADHWTQSPVLGGGRLLGEACHFVDLLRYLAACPIEDLHLLSAVDSKPCPDTFSLQLRFLDGSIGTVHYFANGSKAFPKERLEVFASGKVLRLDNFRKLRAWGIPGFSTRRLLSQDKGQQACCASFLKAIEVGGPPPIPVSELFEVQRLLLEVVSQ